MIYLLVFGVLFTAYIFWLYGRYHSVWKLMAKFDGPPTVPIFGNLLEIGVKPEDIMVSLKRWMREYNRDIFRVYGGSQHYVIVMNAKYIEQILSSSATIFKEDVYKFLRPWLGKGLLISNEQYWVKHRKMITPSFHFQILQDFLHIMNDATDRFTNLLDTFAKNEAIFDFQETVTRSTIDVICECAMGIQVNAVAGKPSPIVNAISDICEVLQCRIFSVFKRIDAFYYFTPHYRTQKKALKILHDEFSEIITKRREILINMNNESIKRDDEYKRPKMAFLDNLLTAEIDGKPLTFQEIFEEVSTFMFEGHDTTASALGFTVFCLSRHADVQEKAFQEQLDLYGDDKERNPTCQELQDMKYLELVLKETLRLFPSVPFIARTTKEVTKIDNYVVPKNTTICVPIIGVGTDERYFDQPYEFRPERFESDKRANANPFDYVPFSAGPRNCIGQKFAMMELKVTISKILRNFQILPAVDGLASGIYDHQRGLDKYNSPYDPKLGVFLTLKSVNGIHVRLKKRVY